MKPNQFYILLLSLVPIAACSHLTDGQAGVVDGPFPLRQLTHSNSIKTTTCGGVLTSSSGEISYNKDEPFAPNERCVWIIRALNTTDYSIGVFNLGFPAPDPNHQVTISSFAHDRDVTHFVPSETGLYNLNNCSVLVITFHSGPTNPLDYNGFSLQYSSFHNGGIQEPSTDSKDIIISQDRVGYFRYPGPNLSYKNMELTSFLFFQSDGFHNPNEMVDVIFMMNGMSTYCVGDSLSVFFFNVDSPTKWDHISRLCSTNATAIFSHNDLILFIFETNGSIVEAGFHVTYSRCYDKRDDDQGDVTTTEGYEGTSDQ